MTELESYVHLIPIDYLIQKIEVRYAHDIVRGRLEVFPGVHPMVRYYPEGVRRLLEDFSHLTICEARFVWDGEGFFDHDEHYSTDLVPPDPILLRVVLHFPFHLHVVRITYLYTMTHDNFFVSIWSFIMQVVFLLGVSSVLYTLSPAVPIGI